MNLSLCGQLTAFIFVYLYFGSLKYACRVKGPPMFAAPVAGASVLFRLLLETKDKDVQNSTLNQRSYIWILAWKLLCENVRLACYRHTLASVQGLFDLYVRVMTRRTIELYL